MVRYNQFLKELVLSGFYGQMGNHRGGAFMAPQRKGREVRITPAGDYTIDMGPGKLDMAYAIMARGHMLTFRVINEQGQKENWKVVLLSLTALSELKTSFDFMARIVMTRVQDGTKSTGWMDDPSCKTMRASDYDINTHDATVSVA